SRRRHTRFSRDWSSDVCSSDLPHFNIGRAAHHLLYLGRKGFDAEFVVRPSEWKDWRTAAARDWRDEQIKAGKTIITDGELAQIRSEERRVGEECRTEMVADAGV